MDKLLDGIVPETLEQEYTIILLATPALDVRERQLRLESIYSGLKPYAEWDTSYTHNESNANGAIATAGVNLGIAAGSQIGSPASQSVAKDLSRTLGSVVGLASNDTHAESSVPNLGANFGLNFARLSSVSTTIGKSETINQHFANFTIAQALKRLERQSKRMDESLALGMWDFAAYVISQDQNVANNVARSYLALTQGEESYLSESAVNLWRGDIDSECGASDAICGYLSDLRHPIFGLNPKVVSDEEDFSVYPLTVTATTALSGKELSLSLNFPQHSVVGLPVFECAKFGRNISTFDPRDAQGTAIRLGDIYHMHHVEPTPVRLELDSLAAHTFVTGSTGAGKTNTVALMLERARERGVGFLVVEPAKGEYRDLLGSKAGVAVFGTNPSLAPLLRLNPFSFPNDVHVLEHLDRLVEIFNVCWPMYAAMPAVLKDAISRSYVDCGWDLVDSTNEFDDDLYPTFRDVTRNIREILDTSEYDTENKGAYKGSLLTRLSSLSNGINGLILSEDEVDPETLFDGCTVVDLSRVGSMETKSLIMGFIVLKLQEHRMSELLGMNLPLRHLTVLEEAHNLLKRTSPDQVLDGGNLLGKSVEMISNAIAEMRTYGEGFIIADQAPGLLDLAAIRNTNTKVIMRLPDLEDRELVGFAASLNEAQVLELAKLPRGVAAVYQNDWVEPVLCKIDRASAGEPYEFHPKDVGEHRGKVSSLKVHDIAEYIASMKTPDDLELRDIALVLKETGIDPSSRVRILRYLKSDHGKLRLRKLSPLLGCLYPTVRDAVVTTKASSDKPVDLTNAAYEELEIASGGNLSEHTQRVIVQSLIVGHLYDELHDIAAFNDWRERGGLL